MATKSRFIKAFFIMAFCALFVSGIQAQNNTLWYKQPASIWTEALPVGNGRFGGMVFGKVEDELIQLNEATLWSGGPVKGKINPDAFRYLPAVRQALLAGDYAEAAKLEKKMQGIYSESFLPMADLHIKQDLKGKAVTGYRRELDIGKAIVSSNYFINGVSYKREVFASAPDQVIVIRITSNKPAQLSLKISTRSQLHYFHQLERNGVLALKGKAPAHVDPDYVEYTKEPVVYKDSDACQGMRYEMLTGLSSHGGKIRSDTSGISVTNATDVTIYLAAATSFNGYDKCPDKDEHAMTEARLRQAMAKPYNRLRAAHLADFQKYFNRVSLVLNHNQGSRTDLPTDERIGIYNRGRKDPGLEALYFQYARYLLISSSRTAGVPSNLQGIWNKELRAPWSSNYTSNINVQMNYWLAEVCNLSEMHEPLFGLIKALSATGEAAAKDFYNASGWVTHHNTDIWAMATPVGDLGHGDPKWANWPMGGDWLCRHLWEHYLYTGDKKFLKDTAYPIMKSAARFTLDWLVPDNYGHLVTAPSMSPENEFIFGPGKVGEVSVSTTMDMGIIRDLFDNLIAAGEVLNMDREFLDSLASAKGRLIPYQIGAKGQLQEWYKDLESPDPHHRHVSHLYSLYPANEISVTKTPALAAAARRSLELRGDEGTGWSLAWKVNLWARLRDGGHAYRLYRDLLRLTRENNTNYSEGGGVYPNMLDAHPPFQIDGNFGGASGLAEMLLQSQDNDVHLLPAIPDTWKEGTVKGLMARGGFVVDIAWKHGQIEQGEIFSKTGGLCRVVSASPLTIQTSGIRSQRVNGQYELLIKTIRNKHYHFIKSYSL